MSTDEVGQEEGVIVLSHVEEEANWGEHFYISLVPEQAPLLIHHLHQIWESPQVCWRALTEISLPAIGKSSNLPLYRVAIHYTIVQQSSCDSLYLPTLTIILLAAINEPWMLLKHHMECFSPPEGSVLLARTQPANDQWGVNSLQVYQPVAIDWHFSILTSCLLSNTLQSLWSGALHWNMHHPHQSGLNASNSLQWDWLHLHHWSGTALSFGPSGAPENSHIVW